MNLPRDKDLWPAEWREQYEERAAIVEYLANKPRWEAERIAEQAIRRMAAEDGWQPLQ